MTGDGVDELMGGSSMYRMSLIERTTDLGCNYFKDEHELIYFKEKISKYDKDFFYKYGEYYGIEGIEDFSDDIRNKFYKYYNLLNLPCSLLKKQFLFSFCFLMEHRKGNFFDTGKNNGFKILTPYYDMEFTKKIFDLNIPDQFLVNYSQTKILNRYIGNNFAKKYGLDFDFFDAGIIDFNKEFKNSRALLISMGYFLKNNRIISEKYYSMIPYFIENSFWFENRMRLYSILNLYVLETLKNSH